MGLAGGPVSQIHYGFDRRAGRLDQEVKDWQGPECNLGVEEEWVHI